MSSTNFFWIENSTTGVVTKPMIFANGRLQCSGSEFRAALLYHQLSGLTIDAWRRPDPEQCHLAARVG
jgi:hypothetical protein